MRPSPRRAPKLRLPVPRAGWYRALPTRLTVTYSLLVVAALVLVSTLTLQLTHVYLTGELDRDLQRTIRSFEEGPARRIRWEDQLFPEARAWLAAHPSAPEEVIAIRTNQGLVLANVGGFSLREVAGARNLLDARTPLWRILDSPAGRVRAAAVPLMLEGHQIGTLVVASSKTRLRATITALQWRIAMASSIGLLLAIAVGYSAVRRSLRPLTRIVRQIASIQASGDLSQRVGPTDIEDEVGQLASAFDRMLARLQDAFRLQQRFLSDASHQLRTPLTVARGHLELLQRELTTAQAQRSLGIATAELDDMAKVVQDLLLLARLDEGIPLERRAVDVDLILREAVLRALPPGARSVHIDARPGLVALGDPDRLVQVLSNLIANAVQHGGSGVALTLRARPDGTRVTITVADTGPGIPADDLPHIFERFYRGSQAHRQSGGVGLGLSIAASLVQAMGGEISVRSQEDQGTTFTVVLPAIPEGSSFEHRSAGIEPPASANLKKV
jgi:signal transduction histidine kinase